MGSLSRRSSRVSSDDSRILSVHRLRRAVGINRVRIIKVNVEFGCRTTELALVAGTEHVALTCVEGLRGGGERFAAVALFTEFESGVVGAALLAESHASLDRHAGGVGIASGAEKTAGCGLCITALGDVTADLLDGRRRNVRCRIVNAQSTASATDFARVARTRLVAASETECTVRLKSVSAETLRPKLNTRETVVIVLAGTEFLTGFDSHTGCVGVRCAGERTRVRFVGTSKINPSTYRLSRRWNKGG